MMPRDLYKFFSREPNEIKQMNSLLMRNYLTNFDRPLLLNYIEGDYQVEKVRKLNKNDFFSPGIALRAQALVKPDDFTKPLPYPVFIEYLFPTEKVESVNFFKPSDILSVKKSPNCAAVVHSAKIVHDDEPALLLTVIPIAYGSYQIGDVTSFEIEPPAKLRPAAGFPVFKD